jgi:hypothetical protein
VRAVMSTQTWDQIHRPHGEPTFRPWSGPHPWHWRCCPCGNQQLVDEPMPDGSDTE